MSDDATPRLSLPYLAAGQAQKHVTLNEALALLDGLVQTVVESRTTQAEPALPADGALYILPTGRTGANWVGFAEGALVRFEAGGWSVLPAGEGTLAFARDESALVVSGASGWTDAGAALRRLQGLERLGVGTDADAVNPFSAKLNKALFTARAVGEGGDGDLRMTFNKEASDDVLSLLFQSAWSGRAELGLVGDDRLVLKVSGDGALWREALRVEAGGELRQPGKPLALAVRKAGPIVLAQGVYQTLIFDTERLDGGGAYDPATGLFHCPAAGRYRVRADLLLDQATDTGAGVEVKLARNGLQDDIQGHVDKPVAGFNFPHLSVEHVFACAAGDTLDVRVAGWNGGAVVYGGLGLTQLIVEFLG